MVAVIRFRQGRELARCFPVKGPAVDQRTANRNAVAAQELGDRMHDDVGTMLERLEEVRRGKGVVDHERQPGVMCDVGDGRDVHDFQARIA